MSKDPYAILGVAKTATPEVLKKAYRKLAKELHPDRTKDDPKATERFKEVSGAYDLLSDPDKRGKFDRGEIDAQGATRGPDPREYARSAGMGGGFGGGFRGQPGGTADLGDIFADLFNSGARASRGGDFGGMGGRGPAPKGANVEYRLTVPFESAARGEAQRLTLRSGKTIEVKLPPGWQNGQVMRLSGQGEAGHGGPGDATVTLTLGSHPHFTRDGDAIRLDCLIPLRDAVLGTKLKIATVAGDVMLNVSAGSTSGKTMRLRERGFVGKDGKRGDQLVTLLVDIPANDPALRAFVEGWQG